MNINLLDILILVGLAQGFVFGLAVLYLPFFKSTPNKSSNKYLAFSILIVSIIGLNDWLTGWGFDDRYYLIDFFGDDVPWVLLLYVPIFIYFLRSARHPWGRSKWLPLLLVPFLVFLLLNIVIDLHVDFGLYRIPSIERFMAITYEVEFYLALVYCMGLCLLAYFVIASGQMPETNKRWLKRIWLFTSILILFWLMDTLWSEWLGHQGAYPEYVLWVAISGFIYWLTYRGLLEFKLAQDQSAVHTILQHRDEAGAPPTTEKPVSNAPGFTTENAYFQELERLIQEEHIHRNPDLSRDVVAEKLGISPGYLSQIINAATGNSFTAYINTLRVEEVKKMMLDPAFEQYSLLAIGMEAGFKSKSAFYTTFKKETGMTPSAFKKQHG